MPRLRPFRALRYAPGTGTAAELLCPPYDVVSPEAAATLRSRGAHNAARLVLPEGSGPVSYAEAGALFDRWRDEGTLRLDDRPTLSLYRQSFERGGRLIHRRALVGRLRLNEGSIGEVLPHESTHAGPREDRFALWEACRALLSPVFVVSADGEGPGLAEGLAELERETRTPPLLEGITVDDGIRHALWKLGPDALPPELVERAGRAPWLIADGHHRFETARALAERHPELPGAGSVLVCVVGSRDPGLLVLPTHRRVTAARPAGGWLESLARHFRIERVDDPSPMALTDRVRTAGPEAIGLRLAETPGAWLLGEPAGEDEGKVAGGELAAVRFERVVLGSLLGTDSQRAAGAGILHYHVRPEEAEASLRTGGAVGALFLLPPAPIERVRREARAGRRLPPKTTYFVPKMPTGLAFCPLDVS